MLVWIMMTQAETFPENENDARFRPWYERLAGFQGADGGVSGKEGGINRGDSTAWGALAFRAWGGDVRADRACEALAGFQGGDGRVSVIPRLPDSQWVTPLALLAWRGSEAHGKHADRAIEFLLSTTGVHYMNPSPEITPRRTDLRGWPWISDTHSWVEPTGVVIIALRAAGHGTHDRIGEAVEMMLDRQLPSGGWNTGSTVIFGKELRPATETTGIALCALAGLVGRERVSRSLDWLRERVARDRSPLSLGWAVFALSAWGEPPPNRSAMILESLDRDQRPGAYDSSELALLLVAERGGDRIGLHGGETSAGTSQGGAGL